MTLRRALGGVFLLLALAPFHRLLDPARIGPFGEAARSLGSANLGWSWWGLATALVLGWGLATLMPTGPVRRWLGRAGKGLTLQPLAVWAAFLAVLGTLAALTVSWTLFAGLPTGVDEMASLLQARFMAEGMVAGPRPDPPGAFLILNTVLTPEGWASLYAPGHLAILAGGLAVGAGWLVGPLLTGITAAAAAVALELALPEERRAAGRLAGLLVALSPFVLFLGAGYWSHGSAAAFTAVALAAALLARERGWGWAILAGASVGVLVTSRPWTGLVLGLALTAGVWLWSWQHARRPARWILARLTGATAGGLPFAGAWLAYNRHLFGSPFRLGYSYAYGPAHGLGFHQDPWGNLYGLREALGYTSANLGALGVNLLETPLSAVILVGAWLVWTKRTPRGTGILLAWASLPLAANVVYWHHGFHMGPRMLYEGAPAWLGLAVLAGVELARQEEDRSDPVEGAAGDGGVEEELDAEAVAVEDGPGGPSGKAGGGSRVGLPPLPDLVLWALLVSVAGAPILGWQRGQRYRHTEEQLARFQAPEVPAGSRPALVFVHGGWAERLGARLRGDGMTLDSLETALRRNDICSVQEYTTARLAGSPQEAPGLDFRVVPGYPEELVEVWLAPGNRILADPARQPTPRCRLEAFADRNGVVSLAPLSWQGDLPAASRGRAMFVRDLGPSGNSETLALHPDRIPLMFFTPDTVSAPVLRPYDEGMRAVWGVGAGEVEAAPEADAPEEGDPGG